MRRYGDSIRVYASSPVWDYLDTGTGVFSAKHPGRGPGGLIIPVNPAHGEGGRFTGKKLAALHFKNAELAAALGFKDENVFLASVKGIKPRWIFSRYFSKVKVMEAIAKASQ